MIVSLLEKAEWLEAHGVPFWFLFMLVLQGCQLAYGENVYVKLNDFKSFALQQQEGLADQKAADIRELYRLWCGAQGDTKDAWWAEYARQQTRYKEITGNGNYPVPPCRKQTSEG